MRSIPQQKYDYNIGLQFFIQIAVLQITRLPITAELGNILTWKFTIWKPITISTFKLNIQLLLNCLISVGSAELQSDMSFKSLSFSTKRRCCWPCMTPEVDLSKMTYLNIVPLFDIFYPGWRISRFENSRF